MKTLAPALALLLLACGSTSTHRVVTGPAGRPHLRTVPILMEGSPLPSRYVEVALVQAVGRGSHADLDHVVAGLRSEASSLGCDAVVRVHVDQGSTLASGTGVAVRTRDVESLPNATAPPPPPPPSGSLTAPWSPTPAPPLPPPPPPPSPAQDP